jgi:hypothetical protein
MPVSPFRVAVFTGAFVLLLTRVQSACSAEPGADFFEKKVRPVLAEHCWKCHGPKKQKGGIRLDGPAYLTRDIDGSGPVLVPGKPSESRLIRAIRREGDHPMPPPGKLPDTAIEALTVWVQMKAPWPKDAVRPGRSADGAGHWAFQRVRNPPLPPVQDGTWPTSPIDHFILARLEARGLRPSPPADRRSLLRRVTFDLIGLPPTPVEVDAFLNDDSPNAFVKVVDRLLASPAYGERWGRHWLDVARFAESGSETDSAFGYSYRDWVIGTFNADLPYDRFLVAQLAGDHLKRGPNHPDLAALGFLTLGRQFDGNEPDIIDDRLDVIGRGLLGLSIGCARCHDHKSDPIPTKDYYSLYGVFAEAVKKEMPLFVTAREKAAYLLYARELRSRRRLLQTFLNAERQRIFKDQPRRADRYLLAAQVKPGSKPGAMSSNSLNAELLQRWRNHLDETRSEFHPILGPWHALAALPKKQFNAQAARLARQFSDNQDENKKLNPLVAELFAGQPPRSLQEVAVRYAGLFARVDRTWRQVVTKAYGRGVDPPERLPNEAEEEIRRLFHGDDAPLRVPDDELRELLDEGKQKRMDELRARIEAWRNSPQAPRHALVLRDPEEPVTPHVFVRGKPEQQGEEVPRQFLEVLAGPARKPFANGTGRLDLARAIASPDNPLTARVWINRVWMHHFGAGLVTTPSDFGLNSSPPSHPELLDWLAARFVANGWSTRQLHRLLVLSSTYQQASADRPEGRQIDPENRLLWRMNRRRLEVEPLRDALLAVGGGLDRTVGGRSVDLGEQPLSGRRTVYTRIDRQQIPGLLRAFDFASPDLHSPQRHETIVPQQALFLLNSPLVAAQARGLAARLDRLAGRDDEAWVRQAYRLTLGREPGAEEVAAARRFLQAARQLGVQGQQDPPSIWQYGYGQWDEKARRLRAFRPLPHFQDGSWRGGPELPDPQLGWVLLTAEGGHPGNGLERVAVRRWVAPCAGSVSVSGTLGHKLDEKDDDCDGVRGQIVSSRAGVLREATACKSEAKTDVDRVRVRAGDTIDFVVDCRTNESNDSFTWPVTITLTPEGKPDEEMTFSSVEEFKGPPEGKSPPLSAREKYAQVLLLTNEVLFID